MLSPVRLPAGSLFSQPSNLRTFQLYSARHFPSSSIYSYNAAGRLTSVTSSYSDANNPPNLFSTAHYNAFGGLTSDTLGDGETETYTYVPQLTRLQSYTAKLNTTTLYNFNITSFAPNGDVLAAADTANGNWTYAYDPFNRLVGSNKNSGQSVFNYVYDRFGNRWQQNGPNSFLATFTGNNPGNPQNNNRMEGYSYDAAGNLLNDGVHSYTFDAENRIIKVDNGNTATYSYDADSHRVQKIQATGNTADPAGTWQFLYDQSGRMIQRFDGTFWLGNVYAGSRHLARLGGGTFFNHSDWLGTQRLLTTSQYINSPTYYTYCASLPFGDALTCQRGDGVANDGGWSALHFTDKPRDAESGLDYFGARFDASSMGRFLSPDWSTIPVPVPFSDLANPQSLNLYSYVGNNPLNRTDPFGHCWSWFQHLCNVVQKAYYGVFSDYGFKTNAQVAVIRKQETEIRRQWLTLNNVVTPDKNGNTIDWSNASSKQVNDSFGHAVQTAASGAVLYKLLHDAETILKDSDIESIRQMSTEDIIKSLNAAGKEIMKIKPDGTVMNGNTRLFVLQERGLNINDLGLRPQIYNSPSLTPWEDEMLPHNPTEKPPDNE